MCMEDIRLGRREGVAVTTVKLPAAGTQTTIVAQSNSRTKLAIYSSNRRMCNIAPKDITPSASAGIAMCYKPNPALDPSFVQDHPVKFDIQHDGLIVTQPWTGVATDGADVFLMVVETFLIEE